jgi:Flp pilus assembly protein TadD
VALATLYARSQKPDQALQTVEKALRKRPNDPAMLTLAGAAYERKGEIDKAREAFQKALEANPRDGAAANNLAWILSEHGGDAEEALRLATLAREVAPDDPQVADTLGWILYKRGIYHRSVALLRAAAAKLPGDALIQYHLGMALLKLEDRPAARQALGRALEIDQAFKGADEARRALASL